MVDIPEHLLQRSKERRKALGLPVPGEEGGEAEAPAADAPAEAAADAPASRLPPRRARAPRRPRTPADVESGTKIPAHLLERAKRRRAAVGGGGGGGDVAPPPAPVAAAAATATLPAPDRPPAPAVTPSGCSRWSSRGRSSRPAPRRRTRCTPGRTCW